MDKSDREQMLEALRIHKSVPSWCEDYAELCRQQHDWDPDTIFGQVPHFDLFEVLPQAIYDELGERRSYLDKQPRYQWHRHRFQTRLRSDEGQWGKDALTEQEVRSYKTEMGQIKAWVANPNFLSASERSVIEGITSDIAHRPIDLNGYPVVKVLQAHRPEISAESQVTVEKDDLFLLLWQQPSEEDETGYWAWGCVVYYVPAFTEYRALKLGYVPRKHLA